MRLSSTLSAIVTCGAAALQLVNQRSGATPVVVSGPEQAGSRFRLEVGPQDQALAHQRMIDSPHQCPTSFHERFLAEVIGDVSRIGARNVLETRP